MERRLHTHALAKALLMALLVVLCAAGLPAQALADGETLAIEGADAPKVGDTLHAKAGQLPDGASICWYVDDQRVKEGTDSFTLDEDMCNKFVAARAERDGETVAQNSFYFSKLPVVYISTEDSEPVTTKKTYKGATLRIQGNEHYGQQYDGEIKIKGRGNTTWKLPKKPYKLTLDKGTDLFGMGKNKHWVLLANFLDPSLTRNTVAQDIGDLMGLVPMDTVWVDVVFNGEFAGNYQLSEQIRIGDSRVDIFDWGALAEDIADAFYEQRKSQGMTKDERSELEDQLETDLSWASSGTFAWKGEEHRVSDYAETPADTNGGFLFELPLMLTDPTQFETASSGYRVMANDPEYLLSNQEMMDFSQKLFDTWDEAINSQDSYTSDGVWVGDVADMESLASYWLAMEIMGNVDAPRKSRFAYIDLGGKLTFGPLWDFDWSSAAPVVYKMTGDGWKVAQVKKKLNFFRELSDDPYFVMLVAQKYWQIRPSLQKLVEDGGYLDQYAALLSGSGAANDALWGDLLRQKMEKKGDGYRTFDEDQAALKSYLADRLAWLDTQFSSVDTAVESLRTDVSSCPYQKSSELSISVKGSHEGSSPAGGVKSDITLRAADDLAVVIDADSSEAATADILANGKKIQTVELQDGVAEVAVPHDALESGRLGMLSATCRSAQGDVVATSYLVIGAPDALTLIGTEADLLSAAGKALEIHMAPWLGKGAIPRDKPGPQA